MIFDSNSVRASTGSDGDDNSTNAFQVRLPYISGRLP
jgi:hypothetical protein